MRAREFISEKASLANMIRTAVVNQQKQPMGQPGPNDSNQTKTGIQPQGTTGSVSPSQATGQQQPAGGTQTPQNGTKPTGALGGFISGLTGGKATSLGSAATLGAAKVAGSAGLGSVSGALQDKVADAEWEKQYGQTGANPQQLQQVLKPGTQFNHPELGPIKVNKITPQGIELDTSQSKQLGAKKVTLDLKSLAQQR